MKRAEIAVRKGGTGHPESVLGALEELSPEDFWLADRSSPRTRRAYREDVKDFVATLAIRCPEELRQIDYRAVIAWKVSLEKRDEAPATIRRRLSALASLFRFLVNRGLAPENPVRDIERPKSNRNEGKTPTFSEAQARKILDAPPDTTLMGLRDRAILSVGFQAGARRSEIAKFRVKDYALNEGYPSLFVRRKRNRDGWLTLHPETESRIRAYLEAAGHGEDENGPLFRPIRGNQIQSNSRRPLDAQRIDAILKKYAAQVLGARKAMGFSAHSMRATFITNALDKGAPIDAVQDAVGHAQTSTTRLYDKRKKKPERSATFFANYGDESV